MNLGMGFGQESTEEVAEDGLVPAVERHGGGLSLYEIDRVAKRSENDLAHRQKITWPGSNLVRDWAPVDAVAVSFSGRYRSARAHGSTHFQAEGEISV